VVQGAANPCDLQSNGNVNVADVQSVINQALGRAAPINDFNGEGLVGVVDVQIEITAVVTSSCAVQPLFRRAR
jgi:hypothetical protein